jgi:diguanylate cyclase
MFFPDSDGRAAEYLRLAIPLLHKNKLPTTPLNFSLFYNYVAGRSARLKEKIDELLASERDWDVDTSRKLFARFICNCEAGIDEELRHELLLITAEIIGSLVDIAGKTSFFNENIEQAVNKLAASARPEEVLDAVSDIMSNSRALLRDSRLLEQQLVSSSDEMNKLQDELEKVKQDVYLDALTGVFNRRGFDKALRDMLDYYDGKSESFCLIMCDIDHFKEINDNFGHLVGDNVLRTIARSLDVYTKGEDRVCRFGGEEFAVILPDTRVTQAFSLAENLRSRIEKLVLKRPSTGESLGKITVSFGVAGYRPGEDLQDFVHRVDMAMYKAKKLGRNRVVLAD